MRKALFFIFIVFVSSCSGRAGIKPDVNLVDAQFSDVTLFETTADFVIRISNENPEPIVIDGASHDIYLNGVHIGKGLVDDKIEIPRLGTATQRVKVRISNLSLIRNMEDLIQSKNFDYKIDSTLYVPGSFGLSTYRVSQSGHFDGLK